MKKEFLKLLKQDEEVQKAILTLCNRKSFDTSKEQDWQEKLETLEQTNKELLQENKELLQKLHNLETKYSQSQETLKLCQKNSADLLAVYEKYLQLSFDTKDSLKGLFKDDSNAITFFGAAIQEKNIDKFWEYIKNEIIEEKNSDISTLVEMFDILFAVYLKIFPHYCKNNVTIGEKFDPQKHIKTSNSNTSGKVSAIVLAGWKNSQTDKIVKQTIVKID